MMKYKKIFLGVVGCIVLASCESNTYSDISDPTVITNPTYLATIKPIIKENCLSCHSAAGGQAPYLETIDQLKSAIENNGLLSRIEAPSGFGMPLSGRMPQSKIDVIKLWSMNGYVNQ
jgi:predicted CXXCH cytochrome family protein